MFETWTDEQIEEQRLINMKEIRATPVYFWASWERQQIMMLKAGNPHEKCPITINMQEDNTYRAMLAWCELSEEQ